MPQSPPLKSVAVISHMYPQKTRENYGVFVSEQVRALAALGTTVSAVAVPVPWAPWPLPSLSPAWRRYAAAEKLRTDFGSVEIRFPRYASFPRKALRGVSASSAARAIVSDPVLAERFAGSDIILAHSALLDGRVAANLSQRFRVPYVVVVHGEDLYQNVRADDGGRLKSAVGETLRGAAAIVAVSDALARGLREAFEALPPVHVVHNGVDTELFSPARPVTDPTRPAQNLRLLSASHLVERKAHAYVLEALADLGRRGVDATLTIAGEGERRAALEDLAARLGVSDRVAFLGAYRHDDLPALLHESDLFVLPSWDEAFGVVYLEALACGVPAIAADDGGATEIVTAGVDGFLVPPKDADALAEKIAAFASLGPDARDAMSRAARDKALGFTWDASARALLGVLRGVVAGESPEVAS